MTHLKLRPGIVDYTLSAAACSIAVFGSAASLSLFTVGYVFVGLVILFTLIAFGIGTALPERRLRTIGPPIYAITCFAGFFGSPWINRLLPNDGYPWQLIAAGALTFMVILGSLTAWTDGALCFQAVPSIAIFGLVGAFDTYAYASFSFFVFIALAASLLFRAHARAMLSQAERAMSSVSRDGLQGEALARRVISTGAWRWMAGPEWALASSLVIISLSVFGAPVLRQSVKTVVGDARMQIPQPPTAGRASTNFRAPQSDVPVGNGPQGPLNIEVLRVKFDRPTYLRGYFAEKYNGNGWSQEYRVPRNEVALWERLRQYRLPNGEDRPFEIDILGGRHDMAYLPGEPVRVQGDGQDLRIRLNGTVLLERASRRITGVVRVAVPPKPDAAALFEVPEITPAFTNIDRIPESVIDFAQVATADARSDLEKAQMLELAVGSQCNYNLRARAAPRDRDVSEFFLFESKEGYCDLFATSLAVTARAVGLPSRVAVGFLVKPESRDSSGYYRVRDSDYHMWTEIYFEGSGWVAFDATQFAEVIESDQTRERPLDLSLVMWIMVAVACVGGAAVLVTLVLKGRLAEMGIVRDRRARLRVAEEFVGAIAKKTGKPRRINETLSEYLERSKTEIQAHSSSAQDLSNRIEEVLYSQRLTSDDELATIRRDISIFRKELNQR